MKLTVIGSAPAVAVEGVPQSGYLIQDEQDTVLFDCGSGVAEQLVKKDVVGHLSAIVISHVHADHVADLISLGYTSKLIYAKQIELWVHEKSLQALRKIFYALGDEKLLEEWFILKTFCNNFQVGQLFIESQEVPHDPKTPTFALKCSSQGKSIAYSADCFYNQELIDFAKNTDVFICEATIPKFDPQVAHMDFKQAASTIKDSQAITGLFCHIHPVFYDLALQKVQTDNIDIAHTGKVIEL